MDGSLNVPMDIEEVCFQIIASVGTAKSMYLEALSHARTGDMQKAREMIKEGEGIFATGHETHMQALAYDVSDPQARLPLLLVHAEDQLMAAETVKVLVEELLYIYERL